VSELAQTHGQKTLQRIGTARGNLAFLSQEQPERMSSILNRFATQYRITPNGMTRARSLQLATADDCAATLVANLDKLTADASYIRGINRVESEVINPHLQALAAECRAFALNVTVSEKFAAAIDAARDRFCERGFGSGDFAGSALTRSMASIPSV
jgi:hypothetical protein